MRKGLLTFVALCVGLAVVPGVDLNRTAAAAETAAVTVFAAASTTNALNDIANVFAEKKQGKVTYSFASSSTLAKQIENGAPANVFLSADDKWMSYLADKKMIEPGSRFDLLGNRLVLIAPQDSKANVQIGPGFDLAALLGDGRLAMGDPAHVPAGLYGKEALQKLKVWQAVEPKVAPAKDVRAALALVERGEAPFGVVYATDAAISKKVKVVGVFPEDSHPPIVYPVALVKDRGTDAAKSFLGFLKSPEAIQIFEKYGFTVR
jgi:molybdate transport system substrate-binding protein